MKISIKRILQSKYIISLTVCLLYATFFTGCGNKTETSGILEDTLKEGTNPALDKEGHEDDAHENEVALTEEQIKIMEIQFSKFENQNISGYIKANGEIMMNQDNESKVGSIIPGRVQKIYVKEGSFVRAGQTLVIIENLDLISAQVEYLEARHEFEHAKVEFDRQEKLAASDIGSKKDFNKLKAEYEHAVIGLKSAEQRLLSYKISKSTLENYEDITNPNELQRYYPITSPISGNIISRNVTVGQYIEPSIDMFHVVNTSTVNVDLSIFEKDLSHISIGQKVELETSNNSNEVYTGKVSFINKVFDDKNRTVKVRVSINNKEQTLYPFMFVTAKIYINEGSVLAVPITAIESEGESKYMFVKTNETIDIESHTEHAEDKESHAEDEHKEDEHKEHEHKEDEVHDTDEEHNKETGIVFKKVLVNTGISDDKYIEIFPIGELKEGEEVVSKGTFYLKSELKKEELGEHEH